MNDAISANDSVEAIGCIGQVLRVGLATFSFWDVASRSLDDVLADVDRADSRAATNCGGCQHAVPRADVEHPTLVAYPSRIEQRRNRLGSKRAKRFLIAFDHAIPSRLLKGTKPIRLSRPLNHLRSPRFVCT